MMYVSYVDFNFRNLNRMQAAINRSNQQRQAQHHQQLQQWNSRQPKHNVETPVTGSYTSPGPQINTANQRLNQFTTFTVTAQAPKRPGGVQGPAGKDSPPRTSRPKPRPRMPSNSQGIPQSVNSNLTKQSNHGIDVSSNPFTVASLISIQDNQDILTRSRPISPRMSAKSENVEKSSADGSAEGQDNSNEMVPTNNGLGQSNAADFLNDDIALYSSDFANLANFDLSAFCSDDFASLGQVGEFPQGAS